MKKNTLIICLICITFSLMAFGYINWNPSSTTQNKVSSDINPNANFVLPGFEKPITQSELVYNIDSRFIAQITKSNLLNSKSIGDIFPKEATEKVSSYLSNEIYLLNQTKEISEVGKGDILNDAQVKLLQKIDYSNNILVKANYTLKNKSIGSLYDYPLTYYMTIIPETEAEFSGGNEKLIAYLKENSKEATDIISRENLKPGRVNFTVTKSGSISNVHLESTSGYPSVDEVLVNIVEKMPQKWNPAVDMNGEKVDQELVFFFGIQGC